MSLENSTIEYHPDETASLRSSTYYKPKNAALIKSFLDLMIADKQDKRLRYDRFGGKTPKTLQLMVLHGWKFLRNHIDTDIDKTYSKLWEITEVKVENEGICIRYKLLSIATTESLVETTGPRELTEKEKERFEKAKEIVSIKEAKGWKKELQEWMVSDQEIWEKYMKLTEEDVMFVQGLIGGSEGFALKIGEALNFIIVVKTGASGQ